MPIKSMLSNSVVKNTLLAYVFFSGILTVVQV